jgi:NhaP-type Na+/H+ or K+/H+ antiporter
MAMMPYPWLLVLCVFGLLVVLGTTSGLTNERLWVSEPLACALAGIALGSAGVGLLRLDPTHDPASAAVLREAARVTLAVSVTGAALRLPAGWARANWRGMAVALGPGMLLMWAAGSVVAAAALGLPVMTALLIGAAVAPTDPVLSAPILTGRLAGRAVPDGLRYALTAESGANDGLALPLVMLPVLLLGHGPAEAGREWLVYVMVWEIGSAVLVGAALGWLASHCLGWAAGRPDAEPTSLVTAVLALALAALAAVRVLGGDGVLAAFVAGLVLNEGIRASQAEERNQRFNEALGRFFDLPVMIVFGAAIPWSAWIGLGWRGLAFAAGVLLLRRPPAWLLLSGFMPWTRSPARALFAGWFGPVGAAAMFYAVEVQDRIGSAAIWPAVSLAVGASIVAHGVTGTPLTWVFGDWEKPGFRRAARDSGKDPLAPQDSAE